MKLIATTFIDGPEARGKADLYETDMNFVLKIPDIWVARGAPDVHLAYSKNKNGKLDDSLVDISMLGYHTNSFEFMINKNINLQINNTIIVYCKQYQAHFGHGVWKFS